MDKSFKELNVDEFEKLISENKVKLLDVREQFEFDEGHIENAQLVPTSQFLEAFEKLEIDKKDSVALYCRSGSRSGQVAQFLTEQGYENVNHLKNGIIEWMQTGKKVVN